MESKGKKRKLVDSLFMTPLQKKKKIQQLLNQNMDDAGKTKCDDIATSQTEEISLESIVKNEAATEFGENKKKDKCSSCMPDIMRDLEG